MPSPADVVAALDPPLTVGERVSLLMGVDEGFQEVIGFVTTLSDDALGVVDRRGTQHAIDRARVEALRRVGVALGRRPESTPRELLDALADRAGVAGDCWVGRISGLLANRTPPAEVAPWGEWAEVGPAGSGVRARFEGEWVTLPSAPDDVVVAAAWWATRMGARSVQVRGDVAPPGFTRLG